jgi:hypothetical protein
MNNNNQNSKLSRFGFRIILLSVSIFILSVTVFSRLIIISVNNKAQVGNKNHEAYQVLSYNEENIINDTQKPLPDIFPKDIPVYPNTSLENYWVSDSQNITGISVVWTTQDALANVIDFYKSEFSQNDWGGQIVLDDGATLTMSFDNMDLDGFVGVTSDEQSVVISLTVGVKN